MTFKKSLTSVKLLKYAHKKQFVSHDYGIKKITSNKFKSSKTHVYLHTFTEKNCSHIKYIISAHL